MQYGQNDGAIGYLLGEEQKGLDCMFLMMNGAQCDVAEAGHFGHAISIAFYTRRRVQGTPLQGEKGQPIESSGCVAVGNDDES